MGGRSFFESLEDITFKGTSNSEELESKILIQQNSKLVQALKLSKQQVNELTRKNSAFEERRDADDGLLALINRNWNQLNFELKNMIDNHFGEAPMEVENERLTLSLQDFQSKLSGMETGKLDIDLGGRIAQSKMLTTHIIAAFSTIKENNEKLVSFFKGVKNEQEYTQPVNSADLVAELTSLNCSLNDRLSILEGRNSDLMYKLNEMTDKCVSATNSVAVMKRKNDELNYNLTQERIYSVKLEFNLQQAQEEAERVSTIKDEKKEDGEIQKSSSDNENIDILQQELEQVKSLSSTRLAELEEMRKENERLSLECGQKEIKIETIDTSIEVAKLKRQFANAINDITRLKTRLEEVNEEKFMLKFSQNQLSEDMKTQGNILEKAAKKEIERLDRLLQLKERDYECLRLENAQLVIISEQTNEIHTEMRHLINSLQSYNKQLKDENVKYLSKINQTITQNPITLESHASIDKLTDLELDELGTQSGQSELVSRLKAVYITEEELTRQINEMKVYIEEQKRKLQWHKQQEETLMQEMDVTGEALEDMQERNRKLLDQLSTKEQAYVTLLSERLKDKHVIELMNEEKRSYKEHEAVMQQEIENIGRINVNLKEREHSLNKIISNLETEGRIKEEKIENLNRRYNQILQKCDEFKIISDSHYSQLKEAQQSLVEKGSTIRNDAFRIRRFEEDVGNLRGQLDRISKLRGMDTNDTTLMDEIKELKDRLLCPCCHVHKKNAVLTNCFHVFCLECLTHLYQIRKRKCPKCNSSFDINEFKRLWFD